MLNLTIIYMYTTLRVLLVVLSSLLLLYVICGYLNRMHLASLIFQHLRLNPVHVGKILLDFQKEQYKSLKKEH